MSGTDPRFVIVLGLLAAKTNRKVRTCALLDCSARTLIGVLLSCAGSGDVTRYGCMPVSNYSPVYADLRAQHDIFL